MFSHAPMFQVAVLITCLLAVTQGAANACDGPREMREATLASITAFIHSKQMTVLTFAGYSGAQYEDPEALMKHASRVLDGQGAAKTLRVLRQGQDLGRAGSRNHHFSPISAAIVESGTSLRADVPMVASRPFARRSCRTSAVARSYRIHEARANE